MYTCPVSYISSTMEVTKLDSASVSGRQQALLEAFQR